jgi:hypothetical protein
LHEIGERAVIQYREKRRRGLVQHALQSAGREDPAGSVGFVHALYYSVGFLAKPNDLADPDLLRQPGQGEPTANAALRVQETAPAEIMQGLGQYILGSVALAGIAALLLWIVFYFLFSVNNQKQVVKP